MKKRFFKFFTQRVKRLPSFKLGPIKSLWAGGRLRFANRILLILLIGLSAYFILDLLSPRPEKSLSVPTNLVRSQAKGKEASPDLKPYSFYTQSIGGWPLFGLKERSAPKTREVQKPAVTLNKLMAALSLMGIIGGKEPQAVIWDRKSKRTYYLKEGQYLDEIMIQDIRKGKVILKYKDETTELVL